MEACVGGVVLLSSNSSSLPIVMVALISITDADY